MSLNSWYIINITVDNLSICSFVHAVWIHPLLFNVSLLHRCRISAHSPLWLLWPAVWNPQSSVLPRPRPSAPARILLVHQIFSHRSPQRDHDAWWRRKESDCRLLGQTLMDPPGLQTVPGQPPVRGSSPHLLLTCGLLHEREILDGQELDLTQRLDLNSLS